MAWKTGTIKFEAAEAIFSDVTFEKIEVGGKTVGYKAHAFGTTYEDTSLTSLCQSLWVDALAEINIHNQ